MTGLARLYGPASALALAGMAWRMGWFDSPELTRFVAVLLLLTTVLVGYLFVVVLFVAAAGVVTWVLWAVIEAVATAIPHPFRSAPGSQP